MSAGGEYLALVSPASQVASAYDSFGGEYPAQSADRSYGIDTQGNAPAPAASNNDGDDHQPRAQPEPPAQPEAVSDPEPVAQPVAQPATPEVAAAIEPTPMRWP